MPAPADPLGAGNTALISASGLNVTPLAFYDVRKNLTVAGGTASSLADVSGVGTYGAAIVQATQADQPAWDGTVLTFGGATFMLTGSAITGLDLSGTLTVALVADVPSLSGGVAVAIGAASGGTPSWNVVESVSGVFNTRTNNDVGGVNSTAATGTGNIRLIIASLITSGSNNTVSIEIPTTAKVSGGSATKLAAGGGFLALGGTTAGAQRIATRFRALIAWSGNYTTGQRDTLKTYATTYHGAVLA